MGQASCTPCPSGLFNPKEGGRDSKICQKCPPGYACESEQLGSPKPCGSGKIVKKTIYVAHPENNYNISGQDVANAKGDAVFICTDKRMWTIGNYKLLSMFELSWVESYSQYTNFPPPGNRGFGGDGYHIGRETPMSIGRHGGQCEDDADLLEKLGSWFSLPRGGQCINDRYQAVLEALIEKGLKKDPPENLSNKDQTDLYHQTEKDCGYETDEESGDEDVDWGKIAKDFLKQTAVEGGGDMAFGFICAKAIRNERLKQAVKKAAETSAKLLKKGAEKAGEKNPETVQLCEKNCHKKSRSWQKSWQKKRSKLVKMLAKKRLKSSQTSQKL